MVSRLYAGGVSDEQRWLVGEIQVVHGCHIGDAYVVPGWPPPGGE